jgi:hypothetical protein
MQLAPLGEVRSQLTAAWSRGASVANDTRGIPVDSQPRKLTASTFVARQGAAAIAAFLVGTGGLLTASYITERHHRGYRFSEFEYRPRHSSVRSAQLDVRSPAENLAYVRAVFEPSITDLASLFGVSRQTIYNWQGGQTIAQQNEHRLGRLACAADIIAAHGLAQKVSVLRRKFSGGKSFFELVRAGSDPEAVAHILVSTLQRELDQRQRLDARLANRTRKRVDLGDVGAPHLDENT